MSAFVAIQLNGYHRAANRKASLANASLKALARHLKLKNEEGLHSQSRLEMATTKLLLRNLLLHNCMRERKAALFLRWRYVGIERGLEESELNSSTTLIKSGLGRRWENPLAIRHFEHTARTVSCMILA